MPEPPSTPAVFADTPAEPTLIMGTSDGAAAPVATLDPPTTGSHCANCGAKAVPGDKFCRGCGSAL